jgi:hypothetical protein
MSGLAPGFVPLDFVERDPRTLVERAREFAD